MCLAYSNIKGNSNSGSHDTDDNGSSFLVSAPEEAMATHSSTLAWKIPWMENPDGLPSMASHRVGHD